MQVALNGCIAQLARACGSYPQCHRFKSSYSHHHGPVVKRPKTPPFHGGNTGSNPVRVTKTAPTLYGWVLFFCLQKGWDENPWGSSKQPETRVRVLGLWSLEYGKMFRVPFATVETLPTQSIPSGSPKQHLPFMGGCCFFVYKKDGMRTRGVRRNSPKPALGFWDCEVLSTAKCFGYRSQRSKHCRRRVSRPGHQKSRSRKWAGFLLFTSYLFTLTSSGNSWRDFWEVIGKK